MIIILLKISQLLMLRSLPTVEVAYAAIQQEKSQNDLLSQTKIKLTAVDYE